MKTLKITKPDDWHVHFREGKLLEKLVPETSKLYNRAIVMPNLIKPIINSKRALIYKNKILKFSKNNEFFEPLITFYLNDDMCPKELTKAYIQKKYLLQNYTRQVQRQTHQKVLKIFQISSNY